MSAIDLDIDRFFGEIVSTRMEIEECTKWINDYETKRYDYPCWKTRDGENIPIYNITDSHLDNLIPFIEKQDPNNETNWIELFKTEKFYRTLKKKVEELKQTLHECENIQYNVF